jgi:hypothetical protein
MMYVSLLNHDDAQRGDYTTKASLWEIYHMPVAVRAAPAKAQIAGAADQHVWPVSLAAELCPQFLLQPLDNAPYLLCDNGVP